MTKTTKTKKPAAAKKTTQPKKVQAPQVEVPAATPQQSQGKELVLTEPETLKLRLFQSEQERYGRQYTLATIQRTSYLKQIDPNGQLAKIEQDMGLASGAAEAARKQYQEVIDAVEARLGVKLNDYSFDMNTGVLHKVE